MIFTIPVDDKPLSIYIFACHSVETRFCNQSYLFDHRKIETHVNTYKHIYYIVVYWVILSHSNPTDSCNIPGIRLEAFRIYKNSQTAMIRHFYLLRFCFSHDLLTDMIYYHLFQKLKEIRVNAVAGGWGLGWVLVLGIGGEGGVVWVGGRGVGGWG